jgi:hypothetical protein
MQFGNWKVTPNEIAWAGKGVNRFVIPVAELTETTVDNTGNTVYRWIILATEEDWLTQDELYDLNYAFVYATGKSDLDFDYSIFDQTLDYQYEELDEEEDDNGEFLN